MTALLVSHRFSADHGSRIAAAAAQHHYGAELLALPPDPGERLPESDCARGNEERTLEIFLENLARWHCGAPLINEVTGA